MKLYHKILMVSLIAISSSAIADTKSVLCLAKNIYYEARGEPHQGKLAVAQVTLNRVNDERFASTICGVVYQPYQFSWTKERNLKVVDKQAWQESLEIATTAINSGLDSMADFNAMYFHSTKVKPRWKLRKVAKIGNHVFYK